MKQVPLILNATKKERVMRVLKKGCKNVAISNKAVMGWESEAVKGGGGGEGDAKSVPLCHIALIAL